MNALVLHLYCECIALHVQHADFAAFPCNDALHAHDAWQCQVDAPAAAHNRFRPTELVALQPLKRCYTVTCCGLRVCACTLHSQLPDWLHQLHAALFENLLCSPPEGLAQLWLVSHMRPRVDSILDAS